MSDFYVEDFEESDLKETSKILADVFESNPAYSAIFANKDKLRDGLQWLFGANLFLINRRESCTKVVRKAGSKEIVGVFSLLPPGGVKSKFSDRLRIGLPFFILKFGLSTLRTMFEMDAFNKKVLTDAVGTNDYYYLSMVAVKEKYQGTSIGSYMIANCLNELRSNTKRSSHIVGLTTQLPQNETFYTRLGFKTIEEGNVQFKQECYYNYNMKLIL